MTSRVPRWGPQHAPLPQPFTPTRPPALTVHPAQCVKASVEGRLPSVHVHHVDFTGFSVQRWRQRGHQPQPPLQQHGQGCEQEQEHPTQPRQKEEHTAGGVGDTKGGVPAADSIQQQGQWGWVLDKAIVERGVQWDVHGSGAHIGGIGDDLYLG